ncbi:MAG TPA: DUF2938 domain-containing protein [Burkholderiales bacterium]|nr:DUF2938 domain-containing protein [Burkholderiales bacterium]
MDTLTQAVVIGTGATVVMDAWGIVRARLLGMPPANYGLVGRWIAWMPRGRFRHAPIAKSPPVRGELAIGWIAHYAIGIAFAGVLLALAGPAWAERPTLWPALAVGVGSVAAPFLVMQPGMGAGIAASRTPKPGAARLQSLVTHAVFGCGLFVSAVFLNYLKG